MTDYYQKKLAGERLRQCYDIASPRVQQYLESEIGHVLARLEPADTVLELGCGYGRVTFRIAELVHRVVGVDVAEESLSLARRAAKPSLHCEFVRMDATQMSFADNEFDVVVCVQNGICAFNVDPRQLLSEALRVTRWGGLVMFSSYTDDFWPHRLKWFETQAEHGLLGSIDYERTRDGVIVCRDGFRSGRMGPDDFQRLCDDLGVWGEIHEVDGSSLFCEIRKQNNAWIHLVDKG